MGRLPIATSAATRTKVIRPIVAAKRKSSISDDRYTRIKIVPSNEFLHQKISTLQLGESMGPVPVEKRRHAIVQCLEQSPRQRGTIRSDRLHAFSKHSAT